MPEQRTKIGIVGCGKISGIYFASGKNFNNIEVVACADMIMERAKAEAERHGVAKALTVEQLLNDPDVEIVVNLTIPIAHAEIAIAALQAGKHVYGEKPFAVTRAQGKEIIELASKKGLRVGCAPDTFLGSGHQTCRRLIDEGVIGEPIAAAAFMLGHGHESWHPDPEFYYAKEGGGPMMDMGPYYITALVNMIGGVKSVSGSARITFPERTITSEKKRGTKIVVGTPTHLAAVLDFANGAIATLVTSFDVWAHHTPNIEVYGTEGSLRVPDPNGFGGNVEVWTANKREWEEAPTTHGYTGARGLGVSDMAAAIRSGRAHRANGALAYHVLDVMQGTLDAAASGRRYNTEYIVERPSALPTGLEEGEIDI